MVRQVVRMAALAGALLALGGCKSGVGNDGDLVGGRCVVSGECDHDSFCLTGAEFPGGYCSRGCDSDEDCPEGSACVQAEGGLCLVSCAGASECRGDDGYDCVALEARGAGGTAMVCARPEI